MDTCKDCKFFIAGACRRYPPTVVVFNGAPVTAFPAVQPYDSCGEHSPKPAPKKVDKPAGGK
jgi:hypothetical protein